MKTSSKKRDLHRLRLGIIGTFKCFSLLRKNKHTHYVLSTFGIGDAMLACAYLRAYKKAFNIPHITMVGKKGMRDVFELYKGEYDELILLDTQEVVQLTDAFLFDFAYTLFYKWKFRITPAVIICHIKNFEELDLKKNYFYSVIKFTEIYKSLIYMLPDDVGGTLPQFKKLPSIEKTTKELGAVKKKSALLCPYANSISQINMTFWEILADKLTQRGFVCFTNVFKDSDKPIIGTTPVNLGLLETISFAQYGGNIVALRSGICDLAQYADCKMAVIFPNEKIRHFYGLKNNGELSKIEEYVVREENYYNITENISKFLCRSDEE